MKSPGYTLADFTNGTIPDALVPYLRNLTLPTGNGYMWPTFSRGVAQDITVIFSDGIPVAWGILVPDEWENHTNMAVMLYVHHDHRQRGLGTAIINRLTAKTSQTVSVFPHNYASRMFFDSISDNPQVERSSFFGG